MSRPGTHVKMGHLGLLLFLKLDHCFPYISGVHCESLSYGSATMGSSLQVNTSDHAVAKAIHSELDIY